MSQPSSSTSTSSTLPPRVASVDGYRGLVMFLMLAEVLHLYKLKDYFPSSSIADWVHFHTTHVEWIGCSLHDMIQPSFSFLVGVSLAFSLFKRQLAGQTKMQMAWHAFGRAMILVFLGIFLRSLGRSQTNFTFEDTLTQIGLGYFFLHLLALTQTWVQAATLTVILVGYWLAFALYPLPGSDFDYPSVGVPSDWPHLMTGFAAHWNKNSNLAWAFDTWFLNLFPRERPFLFNGGGYSTLSFIPTLGTMLLGLIAGNWLRQAQQVGQLAMKFAITGLLLLVIAYVLNATQICPNVKRIWTPGFTLWSGGICFLILLAFYLVCDILRWHTWLFPLRVIGANSIVAYMMSWVLESPTHDALLRHIGHGPFQILDFKNADGQVVSLEPLLLGATTLIIFWLILFWLYRNKIFVRI